MVNATHVRRFQDVDTTHLSKIWILDLNYTKRDLDVTTQTSAQYQDPNLRRNYGTNNYMLRYKRIQE